MKRIIIGRCSCGRNLNYSLKLTDNSVTCRCGKTQRLHEILRLSDYKRPFSYKKWV